MPNHVKNILKFEGTEEDIKNIVAKFGTEVPLPPARAFDNSLIYQNAKGRIGWYDEGKQQFTRRKVGDFNTHIVTKKIPKGFEQRMEGGYFHFPDFEKVIPQPENIFRGNLGKEEEEMCAREGRPTWYDWNRVHWGTKWNSYSIKKESETEYSFETAWNAVSNIVETMSRAFPNMTIHYTYADEDFSYNCGEITYRNGLIELNIPEGGTLEAQEIALKVRPEYRNDMVLVDGLYKWKDDIED